MMYIVFFCEPIRADFVEILNASLSRGLDFLPETTAVGQVWIQGFSGGKYMILITASLFLGVMLGLCSRTPEFIFKLSQRLISVGLIFLLFFLGASLGNHPNIAAQIRWIGFKALVHASFTVGGSILLVWILERWFLRPTKKLR